MGKKFNVTGIMIFLASTLLVCQAAVAEDSPIAEIAKEIVKNVGTVGKIYSEGSQGLVFILEECHTSRVGRLQIAVMLSRLHSKYNLKKIGLEGAIQSDEPISGDWFHSSGGDKAKHIREDIAVRMLAEGEINPSEFMELIYPDIKVYGTELESEYKIKLDMEDEPRVLYLIAIAVKYPFSQDQIAKINGLTQNKKGFDAIEYMLNTDPWTREQYKRVKDKSQMPNQEISQIDEITKRASEIGAQIDPQTKKEMENLREFLVTADKRSMTMARYVHSRLIERGSLLPVAMVIGAGHTQKVIDVLKELKTSCVQLTPIDLNPDFGQLSRKEFDLKNLGKWAHNSPGLLGNLLNSKRMSPPMLETATAKSYASMHLTSILLAEAVRYGHKIPPLPSDLKERLDSLPEIKIDYTSIELDGNDVIFNAILKDTANKEISVWARVGAVRSNQSYTNNDKTVKKSVEEKLLAEISGIKLDAEKSKSQEAVSKAKEDKGAKESNEPLKLMILSPDVKGEFANSKNAVITAKRISQ